MRHFQIQVSDWSKFDHVQWSQIVYIEPKPTQKLAYRCTNQEIWTCFHMYLHGGAAVGWSSSYRKIAGSILSMCWSVLGLDTETCIASGGSLAQYLAAEPPPLCERVCDCKAIWAFGESRKALYKYTAFTFYHSGGLIALWRGKSEHILFRVI